MKSDKFQEGMNVLHNILDNGEWGCIQVILDTSYFKGVFGPKLEFVNFDFEKTKIIIEDKNFEMELKFDEIRYVEYDEEFNVWNYYFFNGITMNLFLDNKEIN